MYLPQPFPLHHRVDINSLVVMDWQPYYRSLSRDERRAYEWIGEFWGKESELKMAEDVHLRPLFSNTVFP